MNIPTDRKPVPFKTRIEKSGYYTPKYPIRPSKVYDWDLEREVCMRAQNPRTFKKNRVRIYGSKEDVFRGRAMVTRGGLRKDDLESRDVFVRGKLRRMVFKRDFRGDDAGWNRRAAKELVGVL